jgi:hypothetical protein
MKGRMEFSTGRGDRFIPEGAHVFFEVGDRKRKKNE